jgi:hypothetical protein
MMTVWLFFILSASPTGHHQAIDLLPSQEACTKFRTNILQMMDMGLASESRLTPCLSRQIVHLDVARR